MPDDQKRCRAGSPRCDFRGTRDELHDHAAEMGHPQCVLCADPLAIVERQTCSRCETSVRDDLDAVARAFAHLERVIGQAAYRGIAWVQLTMSCDGSTSGGGEDDHPKWHDPLPPAAVLDAEERAWRDEFGHGHPPYPVHGHPDRQARQVVRDALEYLRTWHHLAATTYPAFDDYATTIRQLRGKLEHAVGLADDPVRAAAECFDCGGQLVRAYEEPAITATAGEYDCPVCGRRHGGRHGTDGEGLTDDWLCRECRRVYDQPSYFLALRSSRENVEGWVPVAVAAAAVPVPQSTLWRWVAAGLVESRRDGGRIVVEWSQVHALEQQRKAAS